MYRKKPDGGAKNLGLSSAPRRNPPRAVSSREDPAPSPSPPPHRRQQAQVQRPLPHSLPPSLPAGMTAKSYKALTNPKLITVPDPDSIMPSMHTAWKINPDHPMCLIFDAVDPCRKFKRGAVFDESAEEPFADYNPSYDDDLNVTDNDEETDGGTMLMPYLPLDVRCPYQFDFTFPPESFLRWEQDDLVCIHIGRPQTKNRKTNNKKKAGKDHSTGRFYYRKRFIPLIYAQLLDQFRTEHNHAQVDLGHEAQRRDAYVSEVMILAAEELLEARGICVASPVASKWRSTVLTPILQRQLAGVSDSYRPSLEDGVRDPGVDVTRNPEISIGEATEFYLGEDPTDSHWIRDYRRNLIYSRELRWYLAVLSERQTGMKPGDRLFYNMTVEHHDLLLDDSRASGECTNMEDGDINDDRGDDEPAPPFTAMEVLVIVAEGLEFFFKDELRVQHRMVLDARNAIQRKEGRKDLIEEIREKTRQKIMQTHRSSSVISPPPKTYEGQSGEQANLLLAALYGPNPPGMDESLQDE